MRRPSPTVGPGDQCEDYLPCQSSDPEPTKIETECAAALAYSNTELMMAAHGDTGRGKRHPIPGGATKHTRVFVSNVTQQ